MKKITTLALVMSLVGSLSTTAIADTYVCEVKESGGTSGSWIPPNTILEHNTKTGVVTVIDGLIDEVYKQPIAAKIATDNKNRTTYAWSVSGVRVPLLGGGWKTVKNMAYRLTIKKNGLAAIETMKAVGYSNTFRAKGNCVLK